MRNRSNYGGIFLLAFSVLLYEIALTRVFAVIMWHHFTYMVVSMALLGFGAAGSFLTAKRAASASEGPEAGAAKLSLGYGAFVILATLWVTLVRIDSLVIWKEPSNLVALLLIYAIIAIPFIFGGMAIGLLLAKRPEVVNRLYFADLMGSAAGGAASSLLLAKFGGLPTVVIAGAVGILSSVLFSFGAQFRHRFFCSVGALIAIVVTIGFLGGSERLKIGAIRWTVPFAPGKEMAQKAIDGGDGVDVAIPSATAEVEVSRSMVVPPMIGGNFGTVDAKPIEARYVAQDGTAPTMMYKDAAKLENFPFLDDSQAGSSYIAFGASGKKDPNVLVIGVGGGVDVMVALAHGAKRVTAVEINSAMIEMVTQRFDDYLGGLFRKGAHPLSDRIHLVHEEGRSYMRRQAEKYDIIQMSGVDSFTALSTGAYTLSESYLYTKDAVREFYEHLTDDGFINYSRFVVNRPKLPRETIRLSNIARAALEDMGIADPSSHICILQAEDWASTMIKKTPFTAVEVDRLRAFARAEGFAGLLFDPLHAWGKPHAAPTKSLAKIEQFMNLALAKPGFADDIDAATKKKLASDSVGVFELYYEDEKDKGNALLAKVLEALPLGARVEAESKISTLLGIAVTKTREEMAGWDETRDDFATVLRAPKDVREKYIADYPLDISPTTDDRPFFFNYYRYSAIWNRLAPAGPTTASQDRYHPDFPVGHMILLASLVQIMLLAIFLIISPLRSLKRDGIKVPGKWSFLIYFAALGLGFMFLEIALMQRFVIFLGHPTYAVSVVLTSLLGAAGLGSLTTGRFGRIGRGTLWMILLGILATIAGEAWATQKLLPLVLSWPIEGRVCAAVGMLLPLGYMLGMAFPCGVRILQSHCPDLVPWGWAANGIFSVFASISAIVLSMQVGFTKVYFVAGAVYFVGFLFMKPERDAEVAKTIVTPTTE